MHMFGSMFIKCCIKVADVSLLPQILMKLTPSLKCDPTAYFASSRRLKLALNSPPEAKPVTKQKRESE